MTATPWAVLLCTFSDDTTQPLPRSRYEELFTAAGAGTWNMPDYFRDMSHGNADLSGSQVFGWYILPKKRAEYVGSGANEQGREDLITWARQAAVDAGVDLSPFFSVVVCVNYGVDLFGGGSGVVCGDDGGNRAVSGLSPSYLGQEFGHRYGLQHSRRVGSDTDYQDPYDVMSTLNARMAPRPGRPERDPRGGPVYTIGPGLNAANMDLVGWLDQSRVWEPSGPTDRNAVVTIRPLHRRDLDGWLAIRFHGYYVELRHDSGWDAGIENPMVLVHSLDDRISSLWADSDGRIALVEGSRFGTTEVVSVLGAHLNITVVSIADDGLSATVALSHSPAHLGGVQERPGIDTTEITHDGHEIEDLLTTLERPGREIEIDQG